MLLTVNSELLVYGIRQGYGQFNIILNTRPVEEVLEDEEVDEEIKVKLRLVGEIRNYAMNDLGLKNSKNYTTLYDQKGEPILWIVRASEPFRLQNVQWTFPVLGTVSYKGFFNLDLAIDLRDQLRKEGYDTYIREVSAWSTLGWFKDPILSGMLNDDPGDLANTIIHELTHATIFLKDSLSFNENLASFIGAKGAENFLIHKYVTGEELRTYKNLKSDRSMYANHFLNGAKYLDSLYSSFNEKTDTSKMKQLKNKSIQLIVDRLDTVSFHNHRYKLRFQERLPNNAYFMSYLLYRSRQGKLDSIFVNNYNSDLVKFITDLKFKHPR